jgi:hypothetical protein
MQTTDPRREDGESLGQLTAGIAHEIKNPLNFVNNFAGLSEELLSELKEVLGPAIEALAAETRSDADDLISTLTGNLAKIVEHGRRADGIVKSMLLHSRGGSGERQTVNLNALSMRPSIFPTTAPAHRIRTSMSPWSATSTPISVRSRSSPRTSRGCFSTCSATASMPPPCVSAKSAPVQTTARRCG